MCAAVQMHFGMVVNIMQLEKILLTLFVALACTHPVHLRLNMVLWKFQPNCQVAIGCGLVSKLKIIKFQLHLIHSFTFDKFSIVVIATKL